MVVVAILIVTALGLSSAFTRFAPSEKKSDPPVYKSITGKRVNQSYHRNMVRFLSSDRQDLDLLNQGQSPNAFNDGVIRHDFIATGLSKLVAERFLDELTPDLEKRLKKAAHFKPYVHPHAPHITVQGIYQQFVPEVNLHLEPLLKGDMAAPTEVFSSLCDLYIDQTVFPPSLLKQFLLMSEKQYSFVPHDPMLDQKDVAILHNHSLEDWFGKRFIELMASVVINGAVLAVEEGYFVSYPEARAEMIRNGVEVLQQELREKEVKPDQAASFMRNQLMALGMHEKEAVETWQKIMLFRSYLKDISQAAFLDRLLYDDFQKFSNQMRHVASYHMPKEFHMSSISELAELNIYLKTLGVSCLEFLVRDNIDLESLPKALLQDRYLVKMTSLDRKSFALDVSVKETYQWQIEDKNWTHLREKFQALRGCNAFDKEQRLEALDELPLNLRETIDSYSRERIVKSHPEWVEKALKSQIQDEKEIYMSHSGDSDALSTISDVKKCLSLFAAHKVEEPFFYHDHEGKSYCIQVLEKKADREIITFAAAKERGALKRLLDLKLEALYPVYQSQEPTRFLDDKGELLPLAFVREDLCKIYLKDDLLELEKHLTKCGLKLQGGPLSQEGSFYARQFFYPYFLKAHEDIKRNKEKSLFVSNGQNSLNQQFKVQRFEEELYRKNSDPTLQDEIFHMTEGSFSKAHVGNKGFLSFYEILSKKEPLLHLNEEMMKGQDLLASEVKRHLLSHLLDQIVEKKAHFLGDNGTE